MAFGSKNDSVEKFKAWLAALPPAARAGAKAGLREGAEMIADEMRSRALNRKGTGKTAQSVRVEDGPHDLSVVIRAGGKLTTHEVGHGGIAGRFFRGVAAGAQGKQAFYDYALAQEFGTRYMAANPFFWSGYNAAKKKAKRAVRAKIKAALQKAGKK